MSYVDGVPLSSMEVVTDDHMYECGKLAAKVSEALKVSRLDNARNDLIKDSVEIMYP